MLLGFIGDVHAEDDFLKRAIDYLKSNSTESIYCVGDIVDGRGCVNECCEVLLSANVKTVRGNHDRWVFEGRDDITPLPSLSEQTIEYLQNLPITLNIETDIGTIHLCHGYGENDMVRIAPDDRGYALENLFELHSLIDNPDISFVVNGHSHKRMVRKFNGLIVINAGTLHHEHNPCFVEFDTAEGVIQFYDFVDDDIVPSLSYDLPKVINETINY